MFINVSLPKRISDHMIENHSEFDGFDYYLEKVLGYSYFSYSGSNNYKKTFKEMNSSSQEDCTQEVTFYLTILSREICEGLNGESKDLSDAVVRPIIQAAIQNYISFKQD